MNESREAGVETGMAMKREKKEAGAGPGVGEIWYLAWPMFWTDRGLLGGEASQKGIWAWEIESEGGMGTLSIQWHGWLQSNSSKLCVCRMACKVEFGGVEPSSVLDRSTCSLVPEAGNKERPVAVL